MPGQVAGASGSPEPGKTGQVAGASGTVEQGKPGKVAGATGGGGISADALAKLGDAIKGLEALIAGISGGGSGKPGQVAGEVGNGVGQVGQVAGNSGTPEQRDKLDDRGKPGQVGGDAGDPGQVDGSPGRGRGRGRGGDKPGWGNGGFGPPGLMKKGGIPGQVGGVQQVKPSQVAGDAGPAQQPTQAGIGLQLSIG